MFREISAVVPQKLALVGRLREKQFMDYEVTSTPLTVFLISFFFFILNLFQQILIVSSQKENKVIPICVYYKSVFIKHIKNYDYSKFASDIGDPGRTRTRCTLFNIQIAHNNLGER